MKVKVIILSLLLIFSSFRVPETPSKIGYSLSSVLLSQLDNKEAQSLSR